MLKAHCAVAAKKTTLNGKTYIAMYLVGVMFFMAPTKYILAFVKFCPCNPHSNKTLIK